MAKSIDKYLDEPLSEEQYALDQKCVDYIRDTFTQGIALPVNKLECILLLSEKNLKRLLRFFKNKTQFFAEFDLCHTYAHFTQKHPMEFSSNVALIQNRSNFQSTLFTISVESKLSECMIEMKRIFEVYSDDDNRLLEELSSFLGKMANKIDRYECLLTLDAIDLKKLRIYFKDKVALEKKFKLTQTSLRTLKKRIPEKYD